MDDHFLFKTVITVPIREALKEIDSNTWLIGSHRSSGYCNTATWFDDGDNSNYTITDAPPYPTPILCKYMISTTGLRFGLQEIKVIYKVHILFSLKNRTPEDVTLKWVQNKLPDFQVPEVLHSAIHDHRSILFLTRIPGRTLGEPWPSLNLEWRQYYMKAVADICQSMAEWKRGQDEWRGWQKYA